MVDSLSIQCVESKYGLRIQFLALVVKIHEVRLNAKIVTIRSVPHTEDLLVPVPPQQCILDSDDEPTENREKTPQPPTYTDFDFTADLQFNELH
jgi:hypothetical protein